MFKKKGRRLPSIYLMVGCILLLLTSSALGTDVKPTEKIVQPKEQYIEVEKGLLSIDLNDADLIEVLTEIGKQAGIEIKIDKLIKGKITADFINLTLEEGLKRLIKENYAVVVTKVSPPGLPEKYKVKKIMIVPKWKENYKRAITKNITYGRGKEIVGLLSIRDHPRLGPESFSNDSEANLYICDTVNQRVQIFSPDGNHKSTIPLKKGITASDIAIDRFGLIYLYDDIQGKLYQYDKKGNFVNTINVDITRWQSRRPLHIVDDKIYIQSSDQEDVLIGKIIKGLLVAPTKDELLEPLEKGVHGRFSGRKYSVKLIRWERGGIEVIDTVEATIKSIELPIKGIVSIEFLQEDNKGNFYIQTERVDNEKILLEVHKFDFLGNYLTAISIPENDYHSWSIKLLSLDEDGNIFQFLPGKESVRLNVFQKEYQFEED